MLVGCSRHRWYRLPAEEATKNKQKVPAKSQQQQAPQKTIRKPPAPRKTALFVGAVAEVLDPKYGKFYSASVLAVDAAERQVRIRWLGFKKMRPIWVGFESCRAVAACAIFHCFSPFYDCFATV